MAPSAVSPTAACVMAIVLWCGSQLTCVRFPRFQLYLSLKNICGPISLMPVLAKCLERHVTGWILDYMYGPIDPHQFGSLQGSSTVHALIELLHLWHKALDTPRNMVRVLMLDFAKAFDRVNHTTVLKKLANLRVPNFLVRWLREFLCERRQRVKLGQNLSAMVTSQGWSAAGYPGGAHQLSTAYQ